MDDKYIKMLKAMLSGSVTSIQVFILTLIFAIPLALPVAMGRMSKNKLLSGDHTHNKRQAEEVGESFSSGKIS